MSVIEAFREKKSVLHQFYVGVMEWGRFYKKKIEYRKIYKMSSKEIEEADAKLYYEYFHKKLDWSNLRTYTEKMHWAKIYDSNEEKALCTDKYRVRSWVAARIGEEYLIPLLGVWDSYSDIDFSLLPEQFVLKGNHGSGDVVLVKDKKSMTLAQKMEMKRTILIGQKSDFSCRFFEMQYRNIPTKIIAEKLIISGKADLEDYKFLCFDGEPVCCWIDIGRYSDHRRNFYDLNWQLLPWKKDCENYDGEVPKPKNYESMIEIARKLSKGFSHVRVDLYNVDGKIYFGELTFTSGGGFTRFEPEAVEELLGGMWKLDTKRRK